MAVRKEARQRKMKPKMSIRRGDRVEVIAGKDKGKRGDVIRVYPEKNRITVEGVNMVKRHLRRQPGSLQAGIIDMPSPLSRANIMLICPNCDRLTRPSRGILPDGTHVRVCKKCGENVDTRSTNV